MIKDFDIWNEEKKRIHGEGRAPFYHAREIWWCALGINIGFEQDGSGRERNRPVLILKGLSADTCLIVPLTTSANNHTWRPSVGVIEGQDARAIISQMRVIDAKRLQRKITYLNKEIFEQIRKTVKEML